MRPPLPSWDELTGRHNVRSDPPSVQFIDRMVGRVVRMGLLRVARHRYTIAATSGGIGALLHWIATHLLHR